MKGQKKIISYIFQTINAPLRTDHTVIARGNIGKEVVLNDSPKLPD